MNGTAASYEALRTPIDAATARAVAEIAQTHSDVDLTWQAHAACRTAPEFTAAAMRAADNMEDEELLGFWCDGCPVAMACLDFGLDTRASGLFGGFVLLAGKEPGVRRVRR